MNITYITIAKVLGILLVVSGHIGGVFEYISIPLFSNYREVELFAPYSFHMPLFILISGYFFKDSYLKDIGTLIKKRFKTLIIPYYSWNLFYGVLVSFLITFGIFSKGQIFNLYNFFIEPIFEGYQYNLNGPAWFLIALFFIQVVYAFLKSKLDNFDLSKFKLDTLLSIIFILLGFLSVFVSNTINITQSKFIYLVSRTLFGLQFFHLGYYYKHYIEKSIKFNLYTLASIIILKYLFVISIGDNYIFSMRPMMFKGHIFTPFIFSIMGIFYLFNISYLLATIINKNNCSKIKNLFEYINKNTFAIMMHHMLINFLVVKILGVQFVESNYFVGSILNPILCVFLSILFNEFITNTTSKLKCILPKNNKDSKSYSEQLN